MRLRNIPGSREAIAKNRWCIRESEQLRGNWHQIFGNSHPIHVEIGMGKGRFLMTLARENPQINYIGIEKYSSVLLRALQKMEEEPLENIRFIRMDAETITDIFQSGETERIYLNFSDPWPKARHAKRRLTSPVFLKRYEGILKEGGLVEFKTDNRELFEYSLSSVETSGWRLAAVTFDLHSDRVLCRGNVMTEYEQKFSERGQAICKLVAVRR